MQTFLVIFVGLVIIFLFSLLATASSDRIIRVSAKGGATLFVHGLDLVPSQTHIYLRSDERELLCNVILHRSMPREYVACELPDLSAGHYSVQAIHRETKQLISLKENIIVQVNEVDHPGSVRLHGLGSRRRLSSSSVAGDVLHFELEHTLATLGSLRVIVGGLEAHVTKGSAVVTGDSSVHITASLPVSLPAGKHSLKLVHDAVNADDKNDHLRGLLQTNLEDDTIEIVPTIKSIERRRVVGISGVEEITIYGSGFAPGPEFKTRHFVSLDLLFQYCTIEMVDFHKIVAHCHYHDSLSDGENNDLSKNNTRQSRESERVHHGLQIQVYAMPDFEKVPKHCGRYLVMPTPSPLEQANECLQFVSPIPHGVVYLHDRISFPDLHPTKENKPRNLKSYYLRTSPGQNHFRAPQKGRYRFTTRCGFPTLRETEVTKDFCGVTVNGQSGDLLIDFQEGETANIELIFVHLASEDAFVSDSTVSLFVDAFDFLDGSVLMNGSVVASAGWFEHSMSQSAKMDDFSSKSTDIRVQVNGINAVCRHPLGKCALEDHIETRPHHDPFPFPHIPMALEDANVLERDDSRRHLQGGDVLWSNFAAQCGRNCIIPSGTRVILNANVDVDSLIVRGELVWDTSKSGLTLASGFVCMENEGKFTLGTDASPMLLPATIYIRNNGQSHPAIGKRAFGGFAGASQTGPRIEIVGRALARTWTLLTATVEVGSTTVQVQHTNMGWQVGDRIAIAPTILPVTSAPGTGYAETFTIAAISGNSITLSASVTQKYLGIVARQMQAEIINLSRNVRITGDDFDANFHGLHTIMSSGGVMRISYVRIEKAGQRGQIGRYPLHFHLLRSCPQCLFRANAIEDSHQRGIIVHGTHNSLVRDNVLYFIRGAGLYVEDGNEMQNTFQDNVNICHDNSMERMNCRAPGTDNEQGDFVQQSGLWALSVTNNFLGNRLVNHYNAFFTQTSAFPNARGFAQGKVCTVNAPFGTFSGNVCHSNWRFGFYLDNSMPRQLARTVESNGLVTDIDSCSPALSSSCSCQEFKPDGSDNGQVGIVADQVDWFSDFVGCYELGDLQLLRFKSSNNLKNWYWKHTKNFQDGTSSHIKDSEFNFFNDINIPGMPAEGVAHVMGPGGLGAFIVENTKFTGGVGEGALCMNQHCGVGPGTGALCTPEYTLVNVDFSGMSRNKRWIKFGVSDGNPELPIVTTVDTNAGSLAGFRSIASSFQTHLLSAPGSQCQLASAVGKSVEFDGGIACQNAKLRRLQVWSANQGTLTLQGPGGGTYQMKYQSSPCDLCPQGVATKSGYGAVVIAGQSYSIPQLNWSFRPSAHSAHVTIEFSDVIFGTRFGSPDSLLLAVNGASCAGGISSQHSRAWIGLDGPKQPNVGACRSTGPAPPPPTPIPTSTKAPSSPTLSPQSQPGRVLVWFDEFEGTTLDSTKWEREVFPAFAFNNELQAYTNRNDNAFVSNGMLTIRAKAEQFQGAKYTSARLRTAFKGDWTYGRFEARIKLPTGQGLWPAFWMLPTDYDYGNWPKSGEIDILEHVSCDLNQVVATVHTDAYNHIKGTQVGSSTTVPSVADFHVYAVEWTPTRIQAFVDDRLYFEFENDQRGDTATWPFNRRFHLVLNIAVGGFWGGYCLNGAQPVLNGNQDMQVDYVRVYAPLSCTAIGNDPFSSGSLVECCAGLFQCLRNWNNNGVWFYRCTSSQQTCDSGTISPPPTTSAPTQTKSPTKSQVTKSPTKTPTLGTACTNSGLDPYASGSLVTCCAGLQQCLRDWDSDGRWYYRCLAQCPTNAPSGTPGPTLPPAATCTPLDANPDQSGHSCCAGLVPCVAAWEQPSVQFARCRPSCPTSAPTPDTPRPNCEQYSCGMDCLLRATEGCGWSSSQAFPLFVGPNGAGSCLGGFTHVTTSDEVDDGVCAPTLAPTITTKAPSIILTPGGTSCEPDPLPCTGVSSTSFQPCFSPNDGNVATGIGFSFADADTCGAGAVGCVGTSGCRNCRLSSASPVEWGHLPLCPACVCVSSDLNRNQCASFTCAPTPPTIPGESDTKSPTSLDLSAPSEGTDPAVTGGVISGALLVLFLAAGAAVYTIRKKTSAKRAHNEQQMGLRSSIVAAPGSPFAANLGNAHNPIFQVEQSKQFGPGNRQNRFGGTLDV